MNGQVSRGSAGEYQADEQAGVAWLSWRLLGRQSGKCRGAQLASIRQMSRQLSRGSVAEYQADAWHPVPPLHGKYMGKQWKQCQTLFFWAPKSLQMLTAAMNLKASYSLEGKYDQPRQHIKKQRHYFANKGPSSQGYGFSCGRVWM